MKDLTDFNTQKMHMQMIGKADFKDVVAHREMLRRRRIKYFLYFILLLVIILGITFWKGGIVNYALFFFAIAVLIILYLLIKGGFIRRRSRKPRVKKSSWERLKKAPSWVPRKMKRRKSNIVKGEHYVYKRVGRNYLRKKRTT